MGMKGINKMGQEGKSAGIGGIEGWKVGEGEGRWKMMSWEDYSDLSKRDLLIS